MSISKQLWWRETYQIWSILVILKLIEPFMNELIGYNLISNVKSLRHDSSISWKRILIHYLCFITFQLYQFK